jgi:hypothetical protein
MVQEEASKTMSDGDASSGSAGIVGSRSSLKVLVKYPLSKKAPSGIPLPEVTMNISL